MKRYFIVLLLFLLAGCNEKENISICDCQTSWEFVYLGTGNHKIKKYGQPGETYQGIDGNGTDHNDRLIKCADKFGKKYLATGFSSHPDYSCK